MNAVDFCFWLQGFFEITGGNTQQLSITQTDMVRNHLSLVFKHEIDPLREGETTTTPDELNAAHNGRPPSGTKPIMRC